MVERGTIKVVKDRWLYYTRSAWIKSFASIVMVQTYDCMAEVCEQKMIFVKSFKFLGYTVILDS